jgi:hypothetical protein
MARPKKQAKPQSNSIVCPLIRNNGEKHLLETLFEKNEAPEMTAVGYMKLSNGSASWVSYVATFQGNEVKKIEISEPDLRAIAEDASRIDFVQNFIDKGLE